MPPLRSFLSKRKRAARLVQQLIDRFPRLYDAVFALVRGEPQEHYERWIATYDTVDDHDLSAMRDEQSISTEAPLLSLVVPLAHTSHAMLERFAQSLLAQVYERWEVQFVGTPTLEGVTTSVARARTAPVAEAWNAALRSPASDFVVIVDPRVVLPPHALFLFARTIERHPDAVLIYADEDVIDERGARSGHYFKPDWNEALLRSQNYLGGLVALRRSRALEVGGCDEELDGDFTWGLFLRMTADAPPQAIYHLPFILSHRYAGQFPAEPDHAERRREVARALEKRLARVGQRVEVEPVGEASYRTRYAPPEKPPTVSVVMPTACKLEFLRPCLDGVLNRTSYPELEVILVVDPTRKNAPEQRDYLEAVAARPEVRLLFHEERPFNFSRVNNCGAEQARGELVCFLNDDTEVIASDWLWAMVCNILQERVGAVGAMLFYPNQRIQHAGVVLGAGGVAAHVYRGRPRGIRGYHDRALVDQDVSCVTAACMLVRRDVFLEGGGFDEALAFAFNDVDLCLRLRETGWRIVWTPNAELYHKESASIGGHDVGGRESHWTAEWDLIRGRWGEQLMSDPHYSPNLSLDALELWEPAFPPRISYPWRVRPSPGLREDGGGSTIPSFAHSPSGRHARRAVGPKRRSTG